MVTEDIYGERKKKKNLYGTYSTTIPRTQNVTQSNSNGWNEGQNAARTQSMPQSEAVPKPRREKSPSELGEEVVRIMLEDFKEEERQKQAAFDRAARYNGGAAQGEGNCREPKNSAVWQCGGAV